MFHETIATNSNLFSTVFYRLEMRNCEKQKHPIIIEAANEALNPKPNHIHHGANSPFVSSVELKCFRYAES